MGLLNMKNKCFGFTLSEVMIALTLIGVVASLTVPTIGANVQQRARLAEFRTAHSKAEMALRSIIFDEGKIPQCFLIPTSAQRTLYGLDSSLAAGLVNPYNPSVACPVLTQDFTRAMGAIRSCLNNPKTEGCIPNNYPSVGCFDVTAAQAYMLDNGMILFTHSNAEGLRLFALDVNGRKGPNKWGQDIFTFSVYESATTKTGGKVYVSDLKILPPKTCLPRSNRTSKNSEQMMKESTNYQ